MKKEKENAIKDFLKTIEKLRTRERLTDDEKTYFREILTNSRWADKAVKGAYKTRLYILIAFYSIYLKGLGFDCNNNWRE